MLYFNTNVGATLHTAKFDSGLLFTQSGAIVHLAWRTRTAALVRCMTTWDSGLGADGHLLPVFQGPMATPRMTNPEELLRLRTGAAKRFKKVS